MPRRSYTAVFKLQVISYAEEHGNRAAGRKFDVDESNVRKWKRNLLNLQNLNKYLNKCFCLNKSFALALCFVTQVRGAYYT